MDITREEAEISLTTINRVQAQTRRSVAHGGGPYYLMIWGFVWFWGYLAGQFLSDRTAGIVWLILSAAGVIMSIVVGAVMQKRVRRPFHDARVGLFWLALVAYTALIIWLTGVNDPTRFGLLIAIFAMFGYVIMGLWLWAPLAWIGLAITLLGSISYVLIPGYLNLAMAIMGGGTLFFGGWYMLRHWR